MPQLPAPSVLFVSRLVAGNGIDLTPDSGTGVVTVSVSGGTENPTVITGGATPFPINGKAAANATAAGGEVDINGAAGGATSGAGGAVKVTGGAGTAGNSAGGEADLKGGAGQGSAAGGAAKVTGGLAGATGAGGEADITGGAGGATSGAGGAAKLTGGAATASNSVGGEADITGGAGSGTQPGGAAVVKGGVAGATGIGGGAQVKGGQGGATSGAGGNVSVAGGDAQAGNGNGGDLNLSGGAKNGSGVAGVVRVGGIELITQGAPTAATTSAVLTAAALLSGIITVNQGGAGASAQQLPLATDLDAALPTSVAGDAFDFSLINISTVAAEAASITTNTGWTLVGDMDVAANSAITTKSAGRLRARKTGTGAWTLYRLS